MFSDRIWSQMQFTIKWSLVSLVFSKMPGSEWLHARSFFFGHEDHDFLICFDARIYCQLDCRMCSSTSAAEMPTSGDLKSGDCLFFTIPPGISTTLPPPGKIDPAPNENDLGHYMTSYMMYILSKFEIIILMLEIIFVHDKIHTKMPQKPYCE